MPLYKCNACRRYTLKTTCPSCGSATVSPGPAKYSPEDRYGDYRRRLKRLDRSSKGATDGEARA